jgi:Zn ribbon nucleic-acid-binding protein
VPADDCSHARTTRYWDRVEDQVVVECLDCGEVLRRVDAGTRYGGPEPGR